MRPMPSRLSAWGRFFRRRWVARREVVNDISRNVATPFRILQRHYPQFMETLKFQIASRREFERLAATNADTLTDLERAGRFLYLQRLAFGGKVAGRNFGVDSGGPSRFDVTKLGPLLEEIHERLVGGEGGGLADRLFGPVGIAATQFGEAADQSDGIIRHLCRHGILRLGLMLAILRVFTVLVGGRFRQTWYGAADRHRRCGADVGAWRHGRDMGRVENIGSGAGGMGAGRSDVTDQRNARGEHICDDLAHAGVETALCIQTHNNNLCVSFAGLDQSVLYVTGRGWSDRSVDRNRHRKTAILPREGRSEGDDQSDDWNRRDEGRLYDPHDKHSLPDIWGSLPEPQYAQRIGVRDDVHRCVLR
jgi:hypothetical protein